MASGSTNCVLQAGTGPYCLFSITTKVPLSARSMSSGWIWEILALDSTRISLLKSKSEGGGLTEALEFGLKEVKALGVGRLGLAVSIGKDDFRRVSMDEKKCLRETEEELCGLWSEGTRKIWSRE